MKRSGSRFTPSRWSRILVPLTLALLLLGLIVTLVLIILSVVGVLPAFPAIIILSVH